jgi:hypothetical protein
MELHNIAEWLTIIVSITTSIVLINIVRALRDLKDLNEQVRGPYKLNQEIKERQVVVPETSGYLPKRKLPPRTAEQRKNASIARKNAWDKKKIEEAARKAASQVILPKREQSL